MGYGEGENVRGGGGPAGDCLLRHLGRPERRIMKGRGRASRGLEGRREFENEEGEGWREIGWLKEEGGWRRRALGRRPSPGRRGTKKAVGGGGFSGEKEEGVDFY